MTEMELGNIPAYGTKDFRLEFPHGAKPGDIATIELAWTCGVCNRQHSDRFDIVIGQANYTHKFGCNCTSLWSKFKKIFAGFKYGEPKNG